MTTGRLPFISHRLVAEGGARNAESAPAGFHSKRTTPTYIWSLLILPLLLPVLLCAQAPEDKVQELEGLKRRIVLMTKELEQSQQKQKGLEDDLSSLDLKISLLNEEIRKVELEKAIETEKVQRLASDVLRLKGILAGQKQALQTKVRFLVRMGSLGYLRLFFSASNTDFLSVVRWVLHLAHQDRRLFTSYRDNLQVLSLEREKLRTGEQNLEKIRRERENKRGELLASEEQKRFLLSQLKKKEKETETQMAVLKEKAGRLESLIAMLTRSSQEKGAKEDIRAFKGALDWPARGRIRMPFGTVQNPQYSTQILSKGVEIEVGQPAGVGPIFPGRVRYAKWFKGYSNLIVVDHGNGVLSIYGFLTIADVKEGEWVYAGRTLGKLSEAPYTYYLEIRDNGVAVDPAAWLR
jgi:septal ring factor EnvC (AmiA/AmiB activator)